MSGQDERDPATGGGGRDGKDRDGKDRDNDDGDNDDGDNDDRDNNDRDSGDRDSGDRDGKARDDHDDRDDRERPPDPEAPGASAAVTLVAKVQDVFYWVIAAVLLGLAVATLVRLGIDFFTHEEPFAKRVTRGVNGVLFVVIVMELLRTILAHFEDAAFQLKPFLIVGIISAVRHILTVGAELSLAEEDSAHLFHRADVELGINAMVVLVLVLGLVLVRKTE